MLEIFFEKILRSKNYKILYLTVIVISFIILVACSKETKENTYELEDIKWSNIHYGMKKEELNEKVGEPSLENDNSDDIKRQLSFYKKNKAKLPVQISSNFDSKITDQIDERKYDDSCMVTYNLEDGNVVFLIFEDDKLQNYIYMEA